MRPRRLSRLMRNTSGVFREHRYRIESESYTRSLGSWAPIPSREYSLAWRGCSDARHYFCKKCDCKSLHWAFKDRRHCDQCGHTPMNHVCFWVRTTFF